MEHPGQKLKRARRMLKLTYRDVEQASLVIAGRRGSGEFAIALSRLADIENKGTVPTIYRLYTLCAIYRLDFEEVLRWYGVPLRDLPSEALHVKHDETHGLGFAPDSVASLPLSLDAQIPMERTTFLSHLIDRWGIVPFRVLQGVDWRRHRYAWIGLEDWSMHPILPPGSLVVLDEGRRKIASGGWTSEFERPIYFLEHREGYVCGWCSLEDGQVVVQPHPSSHRRPTTFSFPGEVELVGQVTAVAMVLDARKRRADR